MKASSSILVVILLSALIPAATAAADVSITKDKWIGQMSEVLQGIMCAENQYFRKCFNLNQVTCNDEAARAVTSCVTKYATEMPAALLPKDGQLWGSKLSECAYKELESNLPAPSDSAQCKDSLRHW